MKHLRSVSIRTVIICTLLLFPLILYLHHAPTPIPNPPLPPAILNNAFRATYLSHHSFHAGRVKDELLSILDPHARNAVVMAGVGPGGDLLRFAQTGRPVYGFEPISDYLTTLRTRVEDTQYNSSVTLYHMALGANSRSSNLRINYKGRTDYVKVDRIDNNYLPQHITIAAFSIDVQGMEWDVIMGAANTMKNAHSIWVEIGACSNTTDLVLYRLHEQYELFDFIPWGEPLARDSPVEWTNDLKPFAWKPDAPRGIREFVWWFCWLERRYFKWLQSDVVGIRRDIWQGDPNLRERVVKIAQRACEGRKCRLRELLRESKRPL